MHEALTMPLEERKERHMELVEIIERDDITDWMCNQFAAVSELIK
jgi:trehalose-6-phosphate synthase